MTQKITVSGVGCCLVDRLYNNISFTSEEFLPFLSKAKGDGGLTPGQLVFKEEFETFTGEGMQMSLNKISGGKKIDKINIGGPCVVALVHAAQMFTDADCTFRFYGCAGKDEDGDFLLSTLRRTPVDIDSCKITSSMTPSTIVLSDPGFDHGHGERIFINSIGAAWDYLPEELDKDFFTSEIVVFGGTALVPAIHDNLVELLKKAKSKGSITVVNTVYDFRNEKANSTHKWPLGKSDESYQNIDLLITDFEEALRLSGKQTLDDALQFFSKNGTGAVIVTNGSKNIRLFSNGILFQELKKLEMPVSTAISKELKGGYSGDTTGCGDNFSGGVIASLVSQLLQKPKYLDLVEACTWGIVSGGFTCFYIGGTYIEKNPGEKRNLIIPYYEKFKEQINGEK